MIAGNGESRGWLALNAVDPDRNIQRYYLPLDGDYPIILGTGRNSVVFLAATSPHHYSAANEYRAVKFLKNDIDQEYAHESARRFFDEAEKTKKFGLLASFFVHYYSKGWIGNIEQRWRLHYETDADAIENVGAPYAALRQHFFLLGPFYVIELCQGTLHDLLDKRLPWAAFSIYRHIAEYGDSLRSAKLRATDPIEELVRSYMFNGASLENLSGYDILNSFKDEPDANSIRSYAVLELFEQIALSVQLLHAQKGTLAHRDLKPGNIFVWHTAEGQQIKTVDIKLADLGHVANLAQLEHGDVSLRQTWRSPGALVPGSQFFRAPEQGELPIEVRVDVDPDDRSLVVIRSRKVGDIQPGDWLSIGDYFSDTPKSEDDDRSLFKIVAVELLGSSELPGGLHECYRLHLDRPVDLALDRDLQAHVIKSTGYHTDGFSLGAILYDLASGGKNPEHFYTYCLMNFTHGFSRLFGTDDYCIDDVLDIMALPESSVPVGRTQRASLSLDARWRIGRRLATTATADELIAAVVEALLREEGGDAQGALRNRRFRNSYLVSDLLCDHRGVPIPRGLLAIVVRCMLRDVSGAYYMSNKEVGFLSLENQRASERIHHDVLALMSQPQYKPPRAFPQALQTNLLFKLRAFA